MIHTNQSTSTGSDPGWIRVTGEYGWESGGGTNISVSKKKNMSPRAVFELIKKNKMSVLGKRRYEKRMKKLEALCNKYLDNGHYALAEKFLDALTRETKISEMYGAGVKMCISKDLVNENKYNVADGHISDTKFNKYTKTIPSDILKKKEKLDKLKIFDDYVIYHYYNNELEKKKEKKEKISEEEKDAMKDPILFGICKLIPDDLFFIADWEDEYCDLMFDDLVDALNLDDDDVEIPKNPYLRT